MQKFKLLILVMMLVNVSFNITGQEKESRSFTLSELVSYAVENNTSILNAKLDVVASKKKIWETTAIGLPQVSAKVAYQNIFTVPTMELPVTYLGSTPNETYPEVNDYYMDLGDPAQMDLGVQHNTTVDLTVSQLIFNGSYIVGLQASKTYRMLSEQGLDKSVQEVKELVTNSFYMCLVLEETLKNLRNTIDNQKSTQKEIRAMYDAGFVEESDADQVDLILNNLEITEGSFERQIELAHLLLKLQTGYPVENELILNGDLKESLLDINFNEANEIGFSPDNNIDYKLLLTQERLSLLNMRNKKAEFLPSIGFFYNRQEQMKAPDFDFSYPDLLGINIEIPIFSSGQRLAKVSQASIELEKIRNTRKETQDALTIAFLEQRSNFITAQERYTLEERNLELSKKIYDKTLVKYQNGVSGSMELSQANSQYLSSLGNYFNAMYELLSSKTSLYKISGKL